MKATVPSGAIVRRKHGNSFRSMTAFSTRCIKAEARIVPEEESVMVLSSHDSVIQAAKTFLQDHHVDYSDAVSIKAFFDEADNESKLFNYDRWVVAFEFYPGVQPDGVMVEVRPDTGSVRFATYM